MRLFAALLALAPALLADQASKEAKADELLTLMNAESMISQVFAQVNQQMDSMVKTIADQQKIPPEKRGDLSAITKKMTEVLASDLSWDKMKPSYIRIYAEVYDEDEIDGLIAFYKSPVGQTFLKKTPVVMQKSVDSMQGLMPKVLADIQKVATDALSPTKH